MPLLVFIVLLSASLFYMSTAFTDPYITPKWLVTAGCSIVFGMVYCVSLLCHSEGFPQSGRRVTGYSITMLLFVEAVLGFACYMPYTDMAIGTFDNPAGFAACLCAGFPFCIYSVEQSKGLKRKLLVIVMVFISAAILYSKSRTGIVCLFILCACWGYKRFALRKYVLWLMGICITAGMLSLYCLNKESVNGRFLIWKCSADMFLDKPLLGWGTGGFEAHYMDYQAAYFMRNPDSSYAMLADTVQYPFSEYLNIGIMFGIAGLLLLAALSVWLVCCYVSEPDREKECALMCWAVVAVFSLSSYPLMYPFVWVLLAYSGYILLEKQIKRIRMGKFLRNLSALAVLFLLPFLFYKVYKRADAELKWGKIAQDTGDYTVGERLEQYGCLYGELGTDRYFMYNYAAELYGYKEYGLALKIALECRKLWADYDLELLLAELYKARGDFEEAEKHYRTASHMCPNRFVPLYNIVLLSDKQGRKTEARKIAKTIVNKEVKIESPVVSSIIKEMREYVKNSQVHRD